MQTRERDLALEGAIERGIGWLERTQEESGSWHGDYGGPMFLLPLYVATAHVIGLELDERTRTEMVRYILGKQNADGGFGLHIEGHSTVYGTAANYVALRLLGVPSSNPEVMRGREWLSLAGGPVGSASWGKFFLALLGLHPYEGLRPVPPELWLLPESVPFHPSRLWCHCRMVYLPMCWLYGARKQAAPSPLLDEIRSELYDGRYEHIDFSRFVNHVAKSDELSPESKLSQLATRVLQTAEARLSKTPRKKALDFVLHQIEREDHNTNYICIGPINKLLNTLVWFFEDPSGPELEKHIARLGDYLYQAADGIKMQGYNSSRLWDTAFAMQALVSADAARNPKSDRSTRVLARAHDYVDDNQVRSDVRDPASCYRHASKGGWPFSDEPHGWPISDCTAEGIKAALVTAPYVNAPIDRERLTDAVKLLLSMQNPDGGWATYELMRGPAWVELLNPSNCFRDIMVDYSYVECTSACIQALVAYDAEFPGLLSNQLRKAVERGARFIEGKQRPDGSFEGSWGVCFTYGAWFGVTGLRAAGRSTDHHCIRKARALLESKQNPDGGWGETVDNCITRQYASDVPSQVVMTSWAVLALCQAGASGTRAVDDGARFLLERQRPDGTYPNEKTAGVFNKTCAITYDNYLKIFPIWALSKVLGRA